MSYSSVTHVGHDSYPDYPPPPGGGYPGAAPPPPPRPGFEQGYGPGPGLAFGPGYQSYFSDNYPPPQIAHVQHSGPDYPFHHQQQQQQSYGRPYDYSYDSGFASPLKSCLAALCCCCILEQCCNPW